MVAMCSSRGLSLFRCQQCTGSGRARASETVADDLAPWASWLPSQGEQLRIA